MQHSAGTWDSVQKMWNACPYAKAVPGDTIANANEFDEQHAMDLGALWLDIPTVRTVRRGARRSQMGILSAARRP